MNCRIHGKKRHEVVEEHYLKLYRENEDSARKRFKNVQWHGVTEYFDYCAPHWIWVTDIEYEPLGCMFNRHVFCKIVNNKIGFDETRFEVLSKLTGVTMKSCEKIFFGEMIPSILIIEKLAKGLNIQKMWLMNEVENA